MDHLKQSLTQTLSYFDLFSCPLTEEELYRYLWNPQEPISFDTFTRRLETFAESKEKNFEKSGSYFFLPGREEIIAQRERRVWYVEKKLKIAERGAKLLRFLPFVKAFFVCNQIQIGVTQKSDIDVLIVAQRGHLYLTRFVITLLFGLFRLRRGKKKVTDRLCLSFYVTDDALDFTSLQVGEPDIYFTHWLATLIPVYDPQNYLQKFFDANEWATKKIPSAFRVPLLTKWSIQDKHLSLFFKKFFEKLLRTQYGDKLEAWTKKFQLKHMQKNTDSVQNKDTRVVVSDTLLKFHENDRRELFREEWQKRYTQFFVS